MADQVQTWYFTFGIGHKHGLGCYVKFYGTYNGARDKMVAEYGDKWAFQYGSAKEAGIKKHNLFCVN